MWTSVVISAHTDSCFVICSSRASSTLRWRNFKTPLTLWKNTKCFPFTPRRRNLKMLQSQSLEKLIVFENLRFRDGLVWTADLTVEIKLRSQLPPIGKAFSWHISVDVTPNCRNKAAFSNLSGWGLGCTILTTLNFLVQKVRHVQD